MYSNRLIARLEKETDGETEEKSYVICSPAVGVVDRVPDRRVFVNPAIGFLTLKVLNRRYSVELPRDVRGWVTERFIDKTNVPVGYDERLFRISASGGPGAAEEEKAEGEEALDANLVPVTAPSLGVFYRRPSPDAPNYVEEGSAVKDGTVLGLVEVMKCFNQITYGGPGLPKAGKVAKILVEDSAEVDAGQTMFLIKPD